MSIRSVALLTLKVLALSALFFILLMAANAILVAPAAPAATLQPERVAAILRGYMVIALVDTLLVTLIVMRSRWRGWRLTAAVAFSLYGVMTFMAQIETAWFGPAITTMQITPALLRALFLQTVPLALIWVPLAVALLRWGAPGAPGGDEPLALPHTAAGWAWRLTIIAVAYLTLYFGFGYVVAWQNPEVQSLYDSGSNQAVFAPARLIPFQVLRALLWTLFALPVIRMTRGPRWQVAIITGLLLALPMNLFHILPNDLMSASVRLSHFVETTSSNFIFGALIAGLLLWAPAPASRPLAPLTR